MDRRFGTARRVEAASAESRESFIDVIDEDAVDGAEDAVSCMTRKLQVCAIERQIDDAVRDLLLFMSRPLAFEIENLCVEVQRSLQITDFNYRNDLHEVLYSAVKAQALVMDCRDSLALVFRATRAAATCRLLNNSRLLRSDRR